VRLLQEEEQPGVAALLSFSQQRLWFLDQLEPGNVAYNIVRAIRLRGPLRVSALEKSLTEVVRRQQVLRTTFRIAANVDPVQVVSPSYTVKVPITDLALVPEVERETELRRQLMADARQPFDLGKGPLMRVALFRLADRQHVFSVVMHHIVSDGWSLGVFFSELAVLYEVYCLGQPSPLPDLGVQYRDFAQWQRSWLQGDMLKERLSYWRQQLGKLSVLDLPADRQRPKVPSHRGARHRLLLPSRVGQKLKELGQREGATLFMTLLAAFQVLLHHYTNETDISVGSLIANRDRIETERLIGCFVNTVVLRCDLSGNPSFHELLERVRKMAVGAYSHQEVPFEKVIQELQPQRDLARSPLFQVMFVVHNAPLQDPQLLDLHCEAVEVELGTARFDLTLEIREFKYGLWCLFEYSTDLFDAATIARMAGHFTTLLDAIIADPDQRISALPLLTAHERQLMLLEWNATQADFPKHKCFHELFTDQAKRTPERGAIVLTNSKLTYRELNERANQLAHCLIRHGIGPEVLVGICVERSQEMIIGLLAIMKAGGAYLPLDVGYPPDRLALILADCQPGLLLTQEHLRHKLPRHGAEVLCLDRNWAMVAQESKDEPPSLLSPDNTAYVIYTSGSTGKPKGVAVAHKSLVNFLASMQREPGIESADVLIALTNLAFDIAGLELYLPLMCGAQVVIAESEIASDPLKLQRLIAAHSATIMQATPATWRMLIDSGWQGNRTLKVLCGGEALPRDLANQLVDKAAVVWNMYGPTETTIWSTVHRVRKYEGHSFVPIGRPIANTQVYILDGLGSPVPIGVTAEIHIGGAGVATGYFNCPELTAAGFIPDPFSNEPGSRLYKTGDMGSYLPDGHIEYRGRTDQQVKIRGFRIEPGEIEALLRQHPAVKDCLVVPREDKAGEKQLAAYVAARHKVAPTGSELRSYLKEKLPEYMLPAMYVVLDAVPMTPNGKIDHKALPSPEPSGLDACDRFSRSSDPLEIQLTKIWEKILGIRPIGPADNFFELGGHSLLVVRLFTEIHKVFGKHVSIATLFRAPTVETLAEALRQEGWTAYWYSLVPIQPGGSNPPFFYVHSLDANLMSCSRLAAHLGKDQPVYGLQPQGLDGKRAPHTSIQEMAQHYLEEIRTVQPEGPYYLGGACLGGIVAFEMAQQLRMQGQKAALLAMIDSYYPQNPAFFRHGTCRSRITSRADHHLGNMLQLTSKEKIAYVLARLTNIVGRTGSRVKMFAGKLSRDRAREDSFAKILDRVRAANSQAELAYVPHEYPGKITLFWCSEQSFRAYEDWRLGWSEVAGGGLELHGIPGGHLTMLTEPNIGVLARELQAALQRALLSQPTTGVGPSSPPTSAGDV
jgi:amino acid adenylation domain-containing protein